MKHELTNCPASRDWAARFPGRGKLEALGESWGIRNANIVVNQVFDAVETLQDAFTGVGVPAGDIARFREIDAQLAN